MDTKKLIGYIGLGIISAMIIVVILLSVIPVKGKYSPHFEKPTQQITISKYDNNQEMSYSMEASNESKAENFNKVLTELNKLGNYTVMQSLFLGLSNVDTSIKYGKTKTFTSLHQMKEVKEGYAGYLIELSYSEPQTLKNVDGSEYVIQDENQGNVGENVKYTKLAIFVDDRNEITEYDVWVKTSTSNGGYSYYRYTAYANVKTLYDLAKSFKLSASL